jgi:hypothetical protein
MANAAHLKILSKGASAWNKWRRDHGKIIPDLSGADLEGISHTRLDLSDADLKRANFEDATLHFTNFSRAELDRANFRNASLCFSRFVRTTFGRVTFPGADLSYSRIYRGDQRGADFGYAELYSDLQSKGVRCWFAPEDLKIGDKTRLAIDESIRVYDKLLLILSEHSVASDWVEHEVEMALAREQEQKRTMLFPIRLDDAVMEIKTGWPAHIRNTRHIGDFPNWKSHDAYQKSFVRLLRDLKASEGKKP